MIYGLRTCQIQTTFLVQSPKLSIVESGQYPDGLPLGNTWFCKVRYAGGGMDKGSKFGIREPSSNTIWVPIPFGFYSLTCKYVWTMDVSFPLGYCLINSIWMSKSILLLNISYKLKKKYFPALNNP